MKLINEIKPYTYLVKFKPTGKVYYGSRCQNYTKFNRTPDEDFWNYYTTSSENINNLINEHGKDAFEYEIRIFVLGIRVVVPSMLNSYLSVWPLDGRLLAAAP